MYVVAIKHVFDGMQGYLQGVIRGLGLQKIGAYIALIAAYPIQIPLAILFAFKMKMGVAGLWWGDTIGMICQMLMFFVLVCTADWEKITEDAVARIEMESKLLETENGKQKTIETVQDSETDKQTAISDEYQRA